MVKIDEIKLYENNKIRSVWDEEREEWFFSIVDIVEILTDSKDPKQYIKKMRLRDSELNSKWGTICTPVVMIAKDGKYRKTNASDIQGIFRIIQSIPSPKAEPFKMWLAEVGKDRIDEIIDPEITIDRASETYLQKGYSREWINQRLQAIQVRKELTDSWQDHGVEKGKEYAILINEITKAWSGMSVKKYKDFKGLKKENLRDNMTTTELILNMLAETATKDINEATNPQGLEENIKTAKEGGSIAGEARKSIEAKTGKSVISNKKAIDFTKVLIDISKK